MPVTSRLRYVAAGGKSSVELTEVPVSAVLGDELLHCELVISLSVGRTQAREDRGFRMVQIR